MGSIAVQGAVGEVGRKATTELSTEFNSLAIINGVALGANSSGLFQLNSGTQDNGVDYTRTFTLATTDIGISNQKWLRHLYIGIDTDNVFTVSLKTDENDWHDYTVDPPSTGLQRVRVQIGHQGRGRYWTIKLSSTHYFRVDEILGIYTIRSRRIIGY